MKKTNNYYVIGGQYYDYCYGGTPTLIGAKRLANRNQEHWDNWQGWHTPSIYKAEDTELVELDRSMFGGMYGGMERVPKRYGFPIDTL